VPGFFVFLAGVGHRDDAAPRRGLPPAAPGGDGANKNVRVEGAVDAKVEKRPAIRPARRWFQLSDDLHRAVFRRAGDRSAREGKSQQIERRAIVPQSAADHRDQMLHVFVDLETA
jgi:hypothetical protein